MCRCPARCFVDMDGVLCDFMGHTLDWIQMSRSTYFEPGDWHTIPKICELLGWRQSAFWSMLTSDFWELMPWTEEGKVILKICEEHFDDVCILSSPANSESAKGKILWLEENLPTYVRTGRVFLGRSKRFVACPKSVLVDDGDHNIEAFRSWGGIGVLVPRNWNSAHPVQNSCLDTVKQDLIKSKSIIESRQNILKKALNI